MDTEERLVKVLPAPITTKEYVPTNWLKWSEEVEEEEQSFFRCNMIVLDIDFELCQVRFRQMMGIRNTT